MPKAIMITSTGIITEINGMDDPAYKAFANRHGGVDSWSLPTPEQWENNKYRLSIATVGFFTDGSTTASSEFSTNTSDLSRRRVFDNGIFEESPEAADVAPITPIAEEPVMPIAEEPYNLSQVIETLNQSYNQGELSLEELVAAIIEAVHHNDEDEGYDPFMGPIATYSN